MILFSPLLLLWILIVPLFKLLNKFYPASIWHWKDIVLLDLNQDLNFIVKDETEGSKAVVSVYYNKPIKKKFLYIEAKTEEINQKVYINTELKNLKINK